MVHACRGPDWWLVASGALFDPEYPEGNWQESSSQSALIVQGSYSRRWLGLPVKKSAAADMELSLVYQIDKVLLNTRAFKR